jgi:membrane dipeptidase
MVTIFFLAGMLLAQPADAGSLVSSASVRSASLDRALKLMAETPLFDAHNDLPWVLREKFSGSLEGVDLRKNTALDTDFVKLRAGKVGIQMWSVFIPGEPTTPPSYARTQLEQIDTARRLIDRYADELVLATSVADVAKARAQGKIASFLGMEGGHAIENSLGALRAFYSLGVRSMTLTHNVTLDWADSAMDVVKHHGLTDFGREVVAEMNRLGMVVDLSHVTPEVMRDALAVTRAPALFTHTASRALVDHPRNVPDSVFQDIRRTRSVVMVTFIPAFVSKETAAWSLAQNAFTKGAKGPVAKKAKAAAYVQRFGPQPKATLRQVADHLDYFKKNLGFEFVGISGDFYGAPPEDSVVGLENVSTYPALVAELIDRGWSDVELKAVLQGNALRVMQTVEEVGNRLAKEMPPAMKVIEAKQKKN